MTDTTSISSLRSAILKADSQLPETEEMEFEKTARRFERAVAQLVRDITSVLDQIPELKVALEDEYEVFTSPAFPGRSLKIHDQRIRITRGSNMLLFDPTGKTLMSALGQIEVEASHPLPMMVDRTLYLIPKRDGSGAQWGFRSVSDMGGPLQPFTQQTLIEMLKAVFAEA
jgi:hypothetical protein